MISWRVRDRWSPTMRVLARLGIFMLGLVLTLAAGEGMVRLLVSVLHREPLVVSDPAAGWTGKPGLRDTLKVYAGGVYQLSTDAQGRRAVLEPGREPPPSSKTLLLLGDSFVAGMGVADHETFAWLLAHELPLAVVNLGVIGYGTDQELLKLEGFLAAGSGVSGGEIVVLVFDNDFMDVQRAFEPYLARTKPRFSIAGGGDEGEAGPPRSSDQGQPSHEPEPKGVGDGEGLALVRGAYRLSPLDRLMDTSRLFWFLRSRLSLLRMPEDPPSAKGLDLVVCCLEAMRRATEAHGAHLHVLAHRRLRGLSPIDETLLRTFLDRAGAIDITDRVRGGAGPDPVGPDPVGPDGVHWSAEGHRRVASIIEEELQRCQGAPARLLE